MTKTDYELEEFMEISYNNGSRFVWEFTGYKEATEAEKARDNVLSWFDTSINKDKDWTVTSSVAQVALGYKANVTATKDS